MFDIFLEIFPTYFLRSLATPIFHSSKIHDIDNERKGAEESQVRHSHTRSRAIEVVGRHCRKRMGVWDSPPHPHNRDSVNFARDTEVQGFRNSPIFVKKPYYSK